MRGGLLPKWCNVKWLAAKAVLCMVGDAKAMMLSGFRSHEMRSDLLPRRCYAE